MEKRTIISSIKDYLLEQDEVIFAYTFGSFVESKKYRDIDIAIYQAVEIELPEIGMMQGELQEKTGNDIDIVVLNNLYTKKPAFVFNIVTTGELLFNNDKKVHTNYKKETLLRYFDTAYLREKMDQAFKKRLETNKFSRRNYV